MIIPYTGYTRRYLTIHICPMSILCPPWMSIEWLLTPKVLHHGPKGIQRWRVLEFGTHGMDIPGIRGWFGAVETIGIILFRCLRRFRTPPLFSQNPKDIQKFPMENPKGDRMILGTGSWPGMMATGGALIPLPQDQQRFLRHGRGRLVQKNDAPWNFSWFIRIYQNHQNRNDHKFSIPWYNMV